MMIVVATILAGMPSIAVINLFVGVQVVTGVLLPVNLFFIWRWCAAASSWASTATTASSTAHRRHRVLRLSALAHPEAGVPC
jgi:hypothetical protein